MYTVPLENDFMLSSEAEISILMAQQLITNYISYKNSRTHSRGDKFMNVMALNCVIVKRKANKL